MTAFDLLREGAEYGYGELKKSLEGVTEHQAWSVLPPHGTDYLHTSGSIYSIALHTATVKWAYGSISFRNAEIRWRDCAAQLNAFEPSWDAAMDYLERGHAYWMQSWAEQKDLMEMRPTNWKVGDCPAWEIIRTMSQHDSYHAGQIALLRYGCSESDIKPVPEADDVRNSCRDSAYW